MSLSIQQAAKKVCQRRDWSISNLELQKLLYIAQLRHKRQHPGGRLIDAIFQAWDYGPVIPELYYKVSVFGSDPVKNVFHGVTDTYDVLDDDLYASVDEMIGKSAGKLVELTHRRGGAWATYYRPGHSGLRIPDAAIDIEARRFPHP